MLDARIDPVTPNREGQMRTASPLVLHFFGASALGGSELAALAFVRLQPRFQHRALFLEPPGPATELYKGAGLPVASLGLGRLGLGRLGILRAARRLHRHLAEARPDLVHAYGLRPSLLVRLSPHRPALVQAVHSVDAHRPPWQAILDRWTAGRVNHYVTNSEAGARFLAAERAVDPARIRVVPNGIDVERFAAAAATRRDAARTALHLDERIPVIITVANLRPPKGLDTLVEAAAHLECVQITNGPGFIWLVAGQGPLADSLARDLARRGLAGHVRLLGFRDDIPDLLAAADIFCLTSRREGAPISILEAMAAGRPIVATDAGGMRELVAGGETGIVLEPGNAAAIAGALARLIADREYRARLGAAGQARARARHTVERAAAAIAAVYDEMLGKDSTTLSAMDQPKRPVM